MDPLLDEKIVVTLLRSIPEYLMNTLRIHAVKEAYGPSRNEGICYESCSAIGFSGELNGTLYYCMDGYTKLKMLPRIAEMFHVDPGQRGMAESVLLEFGNQMAATVVQELQDGGFQVQLEPPENLSHKMIPVDLERYRQYILIFFLRDRRDRDYYGRAYLLLTIKKF